MWHPKCLLLETDILCELFAYEEGIGMGRHKVTATTKCQKAIKVVRESFHGPLNLLSEVPVTPKASRTQICLKILCLK